MNILDKNLLILASAGSGKTFQLSNRVLGLIANGAEPESVVALTFTRKAAGEFGDDILKKLARAASDPVAAAQLRRDAQMPDDVDFQALLQKLVRALPRMTLGTMDSFFARMILGFPYELGLTSGSFELVQGQKQETLRREILGGILRGKIKNDEARAFLEGFSRANHGQQKARVMNSVEKFVDSWQAELRSDGGNLHWGVPGVEDDLVSAISDWESQRVKLGLELEKEIEGRVFAEAWSREAKFKETLVNLAQSMGGHSTGSGHFSAASTVAAQILAQVTAGSGEELVASYYKKEVTLGQKATRLFNEMISLMARAELAAAIERTHGVKKVVLEFDRLSEEKLRKRGMLSFDEVKSLMGKWRWDEESRLRREVVDYRLNARYAHWLLDEFQDTSQLEWQGISPLIEEAVMEEGQSFFVVGDQKQGIYAWRGGEVGLFNKVGERYAMTKETMPQSWRACPEVLALVNRICGDRATMTELFGEKLAASWPWETHASARENIRGQARVSVVGKDESLEAMAETMRKVGVGERALSCGVLVRTGKEVRDVAEFLRGEGFNVLEEGKRKPTEDNAIGVALRYLVCWLANPASDFEKKVIAMSPLAGILEARYGEKWFAQWEGLLQEVEATSYAEMLSGLVLALDAELSNFGRQRARDVVTAVAEFELGLKPSAPELAVFLNGLEVSQEPGVAAVQVMTIHMSKGLGFDVVMLPKIPDSKIPDRKYYERMRGEGWLCAAPVAWAREQFPALNAVEDDWAAAQTYEAFCLLYVALTRAKRGLYLFFEEKKRKGSDVNKASLQNWVERACADGEKDVIFEVGDSNWVSEVEMRKEATLGPQKRPLGKAIPLPRRRLASEKKEADLSADATANQGAGARFGDEVHTEFEKIGSLQDLNQLRDSAAGRLVRDCLRNPEVRAVFEARTGEEVLCEQSFEVMLKGEMLSGVIDRLILKRDESGKVKAARIVDFKTDAVKNTQILREHYAPQMQSYGAALELIWPGCEVTSVLISTHLKEVVTM